MKRDNKIDILKGILIILVVVGHCIQYGNGNEYMNNLAFFNNKLFKIIYSFHMPLFMLISGYLFYYSVSKRDSQYIIKSKIERLVIPSFIWSLLYGLFLIIEKGYDYNIFQYLNYSFSLYNFLWSLLLSSFLILIVHKVYKNSCLSYIFVIILTFIISLDYLNFFSFLLPYFMLGFIYNKNKEKIQKTILNKKNNCILLFVITALLYVYLLSIFKEDYYIYRSNYGLVSDINNIYPNIIRFLLGLTGSILIIVFVSSFSNILYKFKIFNLLGKNTLGIYMISILINFIFLLDGVTKNFSFSWKHTFIESLIILVGCTIICELIKKNKYLKKYLLGE